MLRWEPLSLIAHYTAQVWLRNHVPCAWHFDTAAGRLIYRSTAPLFAVASKLGYSAPPEFLLQRHQIIDALVDDIAPAQIIELAAGLSPRCLAYAQKWHAHCVDVDLPRVIRVKAVRIGERVPAGYHVAALDLAASRDYGADLVSLIRRVSPTVVIIEGLLAYFPLELQQQMLQNVVRLLHRCGGGTLLVDLYLRDEVGHPEQMVSAFRAGLRLLTSSSPPLLVDDFEAGQRMLLRAGFTRVVGHRPVDWQARLDLRVSRHGSGLCVYQAAI